MPSWISQLLQVGQIVAVLASAAVSLWVYLRSRRDSLNAALRTSVEECAGDIETLTASVNALAQRVTLAEKTIADVPSHRDLEGIRLQVASINGQISALNERTTSTHQAVTRIENFLLESKK
jgi:prefoldin subunit 5